MIIKNKREHKNSSFKILIKENLFSIKIHLAMQLSVFKNILNFLYHLSK